MKLLIQKIAITFEKRDWGAGRATWRERPLRSKRRGPSRLVVRALSTREAKRRQLAGEIGLY